MHYLIYKITNTINNKIYIGCHKTDKVDDGYMGSGKILKRAINKYGIEHFTKEILHNFDNSEDMFNMESELVNEVFVKDTNNYNLKEGGYGGWDYVNTNNKLHQPSNWSDESSIRHINGSQKGGLVSGMIHKYKLQHDNEYLNTVITRQKEIAHRGYKEGWLSTKGIPHSDETKAKIGKKNAIHQQGSGNSQYGTMWITNEKENKKIKKDQPIPEGFRKGRIILK